MSLEYLRKYFSVLKYNFSSCTFSPAKVQLKYKVHTVSDNRSPTFGEKKIYSLILGERNERFLLRN